MSKPIVLQNVWKTYKLGKSSEVHAVQDVSMEIEKGQTTAIAGPSGAGKTTLLSIISLLTTPTQGKVHLHGDEVTELSEIFKTKIRRNNIGIVFQSEYLFSHLTAVENVALPLLCTDLSISEAEKRAEEKLMDLDMDDRLRFHVSELSGGEKQRVSIARALIRSPEILIADEPGSSMDQKLTEHVLEVFKNLVSEKRMTVVVASHNPLVLKWADLVHHMERGKIVGN